jgi:peroxiredoxin family protein
MKLNKKEVLFGLHFLTIHERFQASDFEVGQNPMYTNSEGEYKNYSVGVRFSILLKDEHFKIAQDIGLYRNTKQQVTKWASRVIRFNGCKSVASKEAKIAKETKSFLENYPKSIEKVTQERIVWWNETLDNLVKTHNEDTLRTIVCNLTPDILDEDDAEFKITFDAVDEEISELQEKVKQLKSKRQNLFGDYIMSEIKDLDTYPEDALAAIKKQLYKVPSFFGR